jgi:hypothetical protein
LLIGSVLKKFHAVFKFRSAKEFVSLDAEHDIASKLYEKEEKSEVFKLVQQLLS